MDIFDGRIVVSADDFEEVAYGIEQITAIFEEDINDVIGVLRCSRIAYAGPKLHLDRW